MRKLLFAAATIGLTTGLAAAGGSAVDEIEPNDSLLTSQALGPLSGALAISGSLEAGDVDFYSFVLSAGTLFSASVFDFTPGNPKDPNDSFIGLFDSSGELLASDDDSGIGFLSSLAFIIDSPGTYHLAITGFPDFEFVGEHGQSFSYKAVIASSPIPAPAGLAVLACAGLAHGRRRRR